jgi:MFS family permease
VALAVAVAVAFADSAIVVLALPELIGQFDASIQGVAWVVTSFNLAAAVAALALLPRLRGRDPARLTRWGLVIFLAASAACAVAPNLPLLLAPRLVQGVGAALLLAGSLPLLAMLLGDRRRAIAVWAMAGSLGAALGPAAGGLLTEAFDWRAIFLAQLPPAALALLALPARAPVAEAAAGSRRRGALAGDVALGLVSGALVAALFPAVVLLINGWSLSPVSAALVVSVLPLGTLAARPLARRLPGRRALCGGVLLLAAGLAGLGLLPERSIPLVLWALALCGLGLGLTVPELVGAGLDRARLTSSGTRSVAVRHAGLVLGLVLLTPVLAHDLGQAGQDLRQAGAERLLDAPLSIGTKISLARDLEARVRDGRGADALWEPFREREASQPQLVPLQHDLENLLAATLTRGFRRGFLVAAGLALLAIPAILVAWRRRPA